MRCMCRECGTYMVQADDGKMGCICPECFARCADCLGTDSVISKESFERIKTDPAYAALLFNGREDDQE